MAIHGEIDHYFGCAAPDNEPAECAAIVDALGGQPRFRAAASSALPVAGRGHVAADRAGEEIQAFPWAVS